MQIKSKLNVEMVILSDDQEIIEDVGAQIITDLTVLKQLGWQVVLE